ncbi:MAG: hypothetical protein OEZ54_11510 [Gemmatimonadota bacterium]|nr:hypothetical protein [Gemmatimonadota bacterium]
MPEERTYLPFDRVDVDRIRQLIVTKGAEVVCPICDGLLSMGPPLGGGGSVEFVWQVQCPNCCRSAVVRNLPDTDGK